MTYSAFQDLIFVDPAGRMSEAFSFLPKVGDTEKVSGHWPWCFWHWHQKTRGFSWKSGIWWQQDWAWLSPPPSGLKALRTADFLRTLHVHHHPDHWDHFRDLVLVGLRDLQLDEVVMATPLGLLTPEERLDVEYLCLLLKPWSQLIVYDPDINDKKMDFLKSLLAQRQGACLILHWENDHGSVPV